MNANRISVSRAVCELPRNISRAPRRVIVSPCQNSALHSLRQRALLSTHNEPWRRTTRVILLRIRRGDCHTVIRLRRLVNLNVTRTVRSDRAVISNRRHTRLIRILLNKSTLRLLWRRLQRFA